MSVPVSEFQPLTTDFEVDWDTPGACGHDECKAKYADWLAEGEVFEHGFVNLENGLVVSVLRTNKDHATVGFENGHWEVSVGRKAPALIKAIMGMEYIPDAETSEALGIDVEQGILGDLSNAGVNEFLGRVAALPTPSLDEVGTEDLGGLF